MGLEWNEARWQLGNGETWEVVYKVGEDKILTLTVTAKEPAWETLKMGTAILVQADGIFLKCISSPAFLS